MADSEGAFRVTALPVGNYAFKATAPGFAELVRSVEVTAGSSTYLDLRLEIKPSRTTVVAVPPLEYQANAVTGIISRPQVQDLPLNGRSFLQLAALEPGITVAPGAAAQFNRQFDVSVLGGNSLHTSITVDGGSIWDQTTGGTGLNLSQEVVQEFQVSSVNFDLSTGITGYGAVNIITRSGSNALHGAAYFFYRDHLLGAYPGLRRNPLAPDPYFARKEPGGTVSGPIRKNRAFFFFSIEDNLQTSVYIVQPSSPALAGFGEIAPAPYRSRQITARFDHLVTPRHTLTVRYSHDGNRSNGPVGLVVVSPSNWVQNRNWSDQSMFGFESIVGPSAVNDFRFSFWYWSNHNSEIPREECTAACPGFGLPEIDILGTNFSIGQSRNAPQGRQNRRWVYSDTVSIQTPHHSFRFGGEISHQNGIGFWNAGEPGSITVYSPDLLAGLGLLGRYGLSNQLSTAEDILKLPVYSFYTGVGDPAQPQPFHQDSARQNNRFHFFAQDSWQVRPNVTLNYGVGWSYEDNLLNFDLPKPAFLAPILGSGGLRAGDHNYRNFSPALGFAWRPGSSSRTVIRAGAGIYYDSQLLWERLEERSYLGPFPNGRVLVDGAAIPNPIPGIPGAPLGGPIRYTDSPTGFTAGLLVQILPSIREALDQTLGHSSSNLALRTIEVTKSATHLLPAHYPTAYGEHFSVGIQHQLPLGLLATSDFVFRQYIHTLFDDVVAPDYNHFDAARGPVIPACSGTQAADPTALCSTGPITVWTPGGRSSYKGLLAKVSKSFGARIQFQASYALASQNGFAASDGLADLDNWFANYGPLGPRHVLNLSGVAALPFGMQLSFLSGMVSRSPFAPYIGQIDLSGSGSTYSLLPGAPFNCFNRGCGSSDLVGLVAEFNRNYAGALTPRGQLIPAIALPDRFQLDNSFSSQDLRLAKAFALTEKLRLNTFIEMFNVLNIGNKSGYGLDLNSPGFGQPTQRVPQTFGSGGPRAVQLAARLSF